MAGAKRPWCCLEVEACFEMGRCAEIGKLQELTVVRVLG